MSRQGQTVRVRAGGVFDGASFTAALIDGSGFLIPGDETVLDDSGAYIQTTPYGLLAFQAPRLGKYLVTAQWQVPATSESLNIRSQIGNNLQANFLSPAITGETNWCFTHTTQYLAHAGDYVIFRISGQDAGITPSYFSITYLYVPQGEEW